MSNGPRSRSAGIPTDRKEPTISVAQFMQRFERLGVDSIKVVDATIRRTPTHKVRTLRELVQLRQQLVVETMRLAALNRAD